MIFLLGKAEGPDLNDSNLTLVVAAMVTVATVCLLAAIPVVFARRRMGRAEGIAALMVVWALLSAGSAIYTIQRQMAWSKEYTMRIMQDYNASDMSDRPTNPWAVWGCLAIFYGGALLWSMTARSAPARGFPVEPVTGDDEPPK